LQEILLISGAFVYAVLMAQMTVSEAAKALGVDESTIRTRIRRGHMQAERIGERVYVISDREVERWKERGTMKPGPKPAPKPKAQRPRGRPRKAPAN
jgi:excisionase family DNA binding protein